MKTLSNDKITLQIAEHGAELVSINVNNTEYLWQGDPKFWGRHSPVLFPIVGRVWNNQYHHEGITYELGQHGFARDMDFQLANGKRTLLTNAASKGDKTTISNQRIISATDNADGSRTMRISYTLGGKSMTDTLTVAPNGSKFLIFKNWNITTPLVKEISVYASPAITNFTVNGVKVGAKNATASDSGTYTFNVYPGSYTVKPVTSKYLTADSTTLTTSSESSASISAEPTDALADEINAKIKDKLDTCAKSTDAQPEGCPFSMYGSDDDYRNIAWNITEYPTVTTDDLSIDSGSFYVYGGEAKVAYEYKNYDDSWEPTDSSTSFSISGQFTLDGDKLDITLDED